MSEFWYHYAKLKHGEKTKLCYMDTDSFIVYMKTKGIYTDITKDVETRSDTSNYELERRLPYDKNKKVIGLMKDELTGEIMTQFVANLHLKRTRSFVQKLGKN